MKKKSLIFITFIIVTLCLFSTTSAHSMNKEVRAKIGIQIKSGDRIIRAKSRDRLKSGDLIRLYVHTEKSCFIYIIHTDTKNVDLLNITEQKMQSSTLVLPSAQAFYEIDGISPMENFSIICSPTRLQQLSDLETKTINYSQWEKIQTNLLQKSSIVVSEQKQKSFALTGIAGNVRGIKDAEPEDSFVRDLRIFSGKGLLVKTYEFKIKN